LDDQPKLTRSSQKPGRSAAPKISMPSPVIVDVSRPVCVAISPQ